MRGYAIRISRKVSREIVNSENARNSRADELLNYLPADRSAATR